MFIKFSQLEISPEAELFLGLLFYPTPAPNTHAHVQGTVGQQGDIKAAVHTHTSLGRRYGLPSLGAQRHSFLLAADRGLSGGVGHRATDDI